MAKRILNWSHKAHRLPIAYCEWTEALGEATVDMLCRKNCLCFRGKYDFADEIFFAGKTYILKPLGERFLGFDESDDSEKYFECEDVRKLALNKEAFAKLISESIDLNKTPPVILPFGTDGFYLGELKLLKTYQIFLCFNFSHFKRDLTAILKAGNIPIFYDIDLLNMTSEASLAVDESLGYVADASTSFVIGERQIICSCPPCDIVEFKGTRKAKELFKYPKYPYSTSNCKWSDVEIALLSESSIEIKIADKTLEINFRDISFFCSAKDKPSALWSFFIKTLFGKSVASDSTNKTYQKRLNAEFRKFFGIEGIAFTSRGRDKIEANFKVNVESFVKESAFEKNSNIRKQVFKM